MIHDVFSLRGLDGGTIIQDFFFFVLIPMLLSSIIPSYEDKYINLPLYLISSVDLLFTWYPAFHMGLIAAKYDVANKLHQQKYGDGFINKKIIISIIGAFVMLLGILARNGYDATDIKDLPDKIIL